MTLRPRPGRGRLRAHPRPRPRAAPWSRRRAGSDRTPRRRCCGRRGSARRRAAAAAGRRRRGGARRRPSPARVDEVDPAAQVNPVAGFLLPDHVDESLEVFAVDGTPLGELLVAAGRRRRWSWEPAPGRPLPATRRRAPGWPPSRRSLGRLAAGLVAADASARGRARRRRRRAGRVGAVGVPARRRHDAVDRRPGGRRRQLRGRRRSSGGRSRSCRALLLDVADDLDELELDEAGRAARPRPTATWPAWGSPCGSGELTRTDDGLLGWFLDDDFTHAPPRRPGGRRPRPRGRARPRPPRPLGADAATSRPSTRSATRTCTPRTRSAAARACRGC